MKCLAVRGWLLLAAPGESLPQPVARHLKRCRRCRRYRRRLSVLDTAFPFNPAPAPAPERRADLLARLEPHPSQVRPAWRWWTTAAAWLVGLCLGWWLHRGPEAPKTVVPIAESERGWDELLGLFVEHHLELTGRPAPAEQLGRLTLMADNLRDEALRRARARQPEDLPLLAMLHEQVLRQGMLRCARELPAERRADVLVRVQQHLRRTRTLIAGDTREVPAAISEFLTPLAGAASTTARLLQAGMADDGGPWELPGTAHGSPQAILAALVQQSLLLVGEDDALSRASCSGDVADQVALAMRIASARGDVERASRLGRHLNLLMERGVGANVSRVAEDQPGDPRLLRLGRLKERALQAVESLERELKQGRSVHGQVREAEKALRELDKALKNLTNEKKPGKRGAKLELKGLVLRLDEKTRILTVRLKDREAQREATYTLPADVLIRSGEKTVSLDDLKPGQAIKALPRGNDLIEIRIEKKDD